ncbi:DUF397 domain-containing protein [Streptomyces sp. NPDC056987]|uniref:DUF397 domain-containing protein n=1 Tax=Streptomyces sp. NPDC056987 TaxID=3345988 RepID=UPI00363C7111
MSHVEDATTLTVNWWKSSASGIQSDCVEFGIVDGPRQMVAVRDSKNPAGAALVLRYGHVDALITAIRKGDL